MSLRSKLVVALGLSQFACAGVPRNAAASETADVLLRADEAFLHATEERGLQGWLSFFGEDAAIFPRSGTIVKGLVAVEAEYARTKFDPRGLTWKPDHAELAASGDVGYTYGYWTFTATAADGTAVKRTGKYLTIWKKDRNGAWKVAADIGSPDA